MDVRIRKPAAPAPDTPTGQVVGRVVGRVVGMHCAGCVAGVERSVGRVPGVIAAHANLATGNLAVTLERGMAAAPRPALAGAVEAAGYKLEWAAEDRPDEESGATESADGSPAGTLRVVLGLVLALLTMAAGMTGALPGRSGVLLQFLFATPVCLGFGRVHLKALFLAFRHRSFGMDSLIGLGAGTAYAASVGSLLGLVAPELLFFDVAAMLVAIVTLGRWLESRARGRASDALRGLMLLAPDKARRIRDGEPSEVPVDEVRVGEVLDVRPGERIPLDGRIVRGAAALDESVITGESVPVDRVPGDPVVTGALNRSGWIEIEVLRVASESTLARIAAAVQQAQAENIPLQRIADRVAAVFVPAVMAIGLLTLVGWLAAGSGAGFALARAIAVVVVACPCAVGLAAPIAVVVATGESARRGILFRSGAVIEQLASVRAVAFDKTGTVTSGEPEVLRVQTGEGVSRDELLTLAASAESGSEHPLAQALVRFAEAQGVRTVRPERFEALPGRGVSATLPAGEHILVGSHGVMPEWDPGEAGDAPGRLHVFRNREWIGSVGFRDEPRPEAEAAVRYLREEGFRVALLSGDTPEAVAAIGRELGFAESAGGLRPEQKRDELDRLRARCGPVAMVGDGINDAPALAHADVGIALASGTDIARAASGVTLMKADLRLAGAAIGVARRTVRVIRQNLGWAFGYNLAAIPLAAGVFHPLAGVLIAPEAAAMAMVLSSLSVVLNALRLRSAST